MDNPPEFRLPADHLIIVPTKRESAHLKQQGFNSTHDPFFGNDEYDDSFDDIEGKMVIILQGVRSDETTIENTVELISGWVRNPPIKVTLSAEITNLTRGQVLKAVQEAIQAGKRQ